MSTHQHAVSTLQSTLEDLQATFLRLGLRWYTLPSDIRNECILSSLVEKCTAFFSTINNHTHSDACSLDHPLCHLYKLNNLLVLCQTAPDPAPYLIIAENSIKAFQEKFVVPRIIVERQSSFLPSTGAREDVLGQAMRRLDFTSESGWKQWILAVPMVQGWIEKGMGEEECMKMAMQFADEETRKAMGWMEEPKCEGPKETGFFGALALRPR